MGGVTGESGACEAGSAFSCAGGVKMGGASDGIAGIGVEGDVFNGGVAGAKEGQEDYSRLLSSSKSLRSSASLRRFLVFFGRWWLDFRQRWRRWCCQRR